MEIIAISIIILFFFYKQSTSEFRINQLEWTQKENIGSVLSEHIPFVLRSIPPATFWTKNDVQQRTCFSLPIFKDTTLQKWVSQNNPCICPWSDVEARQIASVSGINVWAEKWMNSLIYPFSFWMVPIYQCWAGTVGLRKTFAHWTCIFPVDGDILLSISPQSVHSYLPQSWKNCIPSQLTAKDTPFINELKYIDIILRPGTCMFIPAHWFISWKSDDSLPMVCTISYHSPISFVASLFS